MHPPRRRPGHVSPGASGAVVLLTLPGKPVRRAVVPAQADLNTSSPSSFRHVHVLDALAGHRSESLRGTWGVADATAGTDCCSRDAVALGDRFGAGQRSARAEIL